ncbi:MAG: tRNA (adenosine(37)-N6)-threonylcarbamoyltransferase complex dimerization subunit type 1 TsaB [Clostridia bacterium]|nr:tRNA (adenosine(37)-N6)-threonylcarbamoyltransferase complex dimerization subunit type 1 TsaB [Clostridia bacterium]
MNILAVETTGAHASAAIINEKEEITEIRGDGVLNHLQSITVMIDEIVKERLSSIDDVDVIAASEGPGSFTGIRIGVSTVRALAQALGKPVIAVPTLQTFVFNNPDFEGIVCPIFDARRSEIYGGAYAKEIIHVEKEHGDDSENEEAIEEIVVGAAYDIGEYLDRLSQELRERCREDMSESELLQIRFFGDGIEKYRPRIEEWADAQRELGRKYDITYAEEEPFQTATSVSKLALRLYNEGKTVSPYELRPNYMRKAEAERKLEEAQKTKGSER